MTKNTPPHNPAPREAGFMEAARQKDKLLRRYVAALAHLDEYKRLTILASWMPIEALKDCVEYQEQEP